MKRILLGAWLGSLALTGRGPALAQPPGPTPPPVGLTAEQDHRRLLDLLKITALRPGADPRGADAANPANYDEAKANPYPKLPDPLMLKDGTRVTTPELWQRRRAEIVEDFEREVYGRVPPEVPPVRWTVTGTSRETSAGVPVVTKHLRGHVDNSAHRALSVTLEATLTTPARATGPVPVMVHFGFRFPAARPGSTAPAEAGPTWQEQLIAKGWGHATLLATSVQPDSGAGLAQGIIGLANRGQPRKLDDWGALRAWAWGASRLLDYLETDPAVDAKRVGIEGLSRFGKAAAVAMAFDPRFAIALVGSSGAAGLKLHRRNFGELVENVAGVGEYHWMAGNYLKYAGPLTWDDLPVDAHELLALCAPRPVFVSAGSPQVEGGWIDQRGMFMAAVAAGPVYRLLGKKDLGAAEYPPAETALVGGELAFRQHAGGHTTGPNWPTFLSFAERYLGGGSTAGVAPAARARVALTFDDLPVHGAVPPGRARLDVLRDIVTALRDAKAPAVYGFVNAQPVADAPENAAILRLWRDAGFPLGNHAFSHMDLHQHTAAEFEADVLANEPTLRGLMGDGDWHWFRFPYLHEGETLDKHRAVAARLRTHGYRVAEVTLSFDDWAYHDPYARCLARDDQQAIAWLKESYLARAAESLTRGQETARLLYGHDIPHVMLLHVGGLNAVLLPRLLALLRERGFELVTLEEAEGDPAYAADPGIAMPSGATWLDRVATARQLTRPAGGESPLPKLSALCR
jgi:(4-O-methyl)-D-glucuronate---lignin esterase